MASSIVKRKYLVIAMDMSNSAAGIVFKRLLKAMLQYVDIDIICPNTDEDAKGFVTTLHAPAYKRIHRRIENPIFNKFGVKLSDIIWFIKARFSLYSLIKTNTYDGVISFVYGGNDSPFLLGKYLSQQIRKPWIIYSVDAIPLPETMNPIVALRKKRIAFLNHYFSNANAIFSSNPMMLQYERATFPCFKGFSGIVLTPYDDTKGRNKTYSGGNKELTTFLFTGHIYGTRNIKYLLQGYEKLLSVNNKIKMVFVGNSDVSYLSGFEHLLNKGYVENHGFSKNLDLFYNDADVLLDVNSDTVNDVFLSSKVCNYIPYDKPIVSISQEGSPVRLLMQGVKSVIHCHHNAEEIFEGLQKAVDISKGVIDDRENLKKVFSPTSVAFSFCNDLEEVITKQ